MELQIIARNAIARVELDTRCPRTNNGRWACVESASKGLARGCHYANLVDHRASTHKSKGKASTGLIGQSNDSITTRFI